MVSRYQVIGGKIQNTLGHGQVWCCVAGFGSVPRGKVRSGLVGIYIYTVGD